MANVVDIQRASKVVPFTITPIGDKQALAYWKLERAKIEREWELAQAPKRAERRAIAIKQIEEQLGRKFKEDEKEELETLAGVVPAKRQRVKVFEQPFSISERDKVVDFETSLEREQRRPLSTKIKESLIKFWNSAFPK